jgi:voltage-gated potassium channel
MFIATVAVLAYLLRIFEIPFYRANETLNNDMDYYFNALWLTLITLTTVGYGDIAPKTNAGKVVMVITALFGSFLISMLVLAVGKVFDLNQNQ